MKQLFRCPVHGLFERVISGPRAVSCNCPHRVDTGVLKLREFCNIQSKAQERNATAH